MEASPSLIGRKWEVERILTILNRRAPALIVLSGAPGSGKSRLLHAIQASALQQGWKTVPQHAADQLTVGRQTSRNSFTDYLLTMLPPQAQEGFETVGHKDRLGGIGRSDSSPPPQRPDSTSASGLIARLRQLEPLVVLIDRYDPEPDFEKWLLEAFIGGLDPASSTVVVVATEQEGIDDPRSELVSLASLDRTEVLNHFKALTSDVDPPMTEAELDHYVNVASETPAVIDSLERVLKVACRQATSSSSLR